MVEREREIQNFVKREYWSIEADFEKDKLKFTAKLHAIAGKTLEKFQIKTETEAQTILKRLTGAKFAVDSITRKTLERHPAPPFTTSTLQQEAARKFGMSAKQTMLVAQQLYEGLELGEEGGVGLITYMRTDSVNLAELSLVQIRSVIQTHFGSEYALPEVRRFRNKSKGAQEAHEAIRPSDANRTPDSIAQYLDRNQKKIYELIWKRTVASQMKPAVLEQTAVNIEAQKPGLGAQHLFRATGQVVKFDGFIRAYVEGTDEKSEEEPTDALPALSEKEPLNLLAINPLQHFTEPPGRYSDATLIKALEAHGIGRPSTYAPTLTTIQSRGYVEKKEKRYHPSEVGIIVNDLLVENFPEIVDINFTSHVEEELDQIAEGTIGWQEVAKEFYEPFKKHLIEKEATVEKHIELSATPCPHCNELMVVKFGRMGKFLACPDPKIKMTLPMPEEAAKIKELQEKTQNEKCPICASPMDVKRGRFGYFLGCSRYPACRGMSKILNRTGFKCPNCEARRILGEVGSDYQIGDVVEKKSRGRGKIFYACTRYPDCEFLTNTKPESETDLVSALNNWNKNHSKKTSAKKKSTPAT